MLAGLALGVAVTGGGAVWSHIASQRALEVLGRFAAEPGRFDAAGLALDQARLYAAALETLAGAPPVILRQRYEAFVAAIARIRSDEWRVLFAPLPRFQETLAQLDALVARIDDLLGASAGVPTAPMPQAAVIELTRLLPPLREPLADLALAFDAAASVQVAQAVRRLERIRMAEAAATGAFLVAILGLATAGLLVVRGLPRGEGDGFALPPPSPVFAGAPMLAATARDLAGPLHRVAGTFGMVLDAPGLDADSARAARSALDAAEDLLDLSDALAEAASLAAGRVDPVRTAFDPVETVGDVLRALEARIGELGGRAAIVGGDDTAGNARPAHRVVGDPARFVRLVKALIVRMLPLGSGATLGIAVRAEGQELAVVVGDAATASLGPAAFETVELRDSWPGQDLTDGLSPAIALSEALGGRLARARAGAGRVETVRAVLPFPPVTEAMLREAAAEWQRSLSLLAVDDVPTNRRLLAAMLARHGHSCDLAADVTEAMRLLRENPYDAVLMDVQMPGIDGLTATRMIRALPPPVGQIPVIAVTAHVLPDQGEVFRAAGMNGVIAKPVATAALLDALDRLVLPAAVGLAPMRSETVALLDDETLTLIRSTLTPADFSRFVERQTAEGAAALAEADAAMRRGDRAGLAAAIRAVAAAYEPIGAPRVTAEARQAEDAASTEGLARLRAAAEATEQALRGRAIGSRQAGWSGERAGTI
jgi:CheY-like chemotaxis protein